VDMAVVMCSRARCRFRGFRTRTWAENGHVRGRFSMCEFRKYLILLGVVLCNKTKDLGVKKESHIAAHGACASFFLMILITCKLAHGVS
jgi:hypothetical protein